MTGDKGDAAFGVLLSTSRAQDAGYLAAHDVQVSCEAAALEYRLIGGISVTLLTWVHGVVDVVPARETADADLGATHQVLAGGTVVALLRERGYRQVAGSRFERQAAYDADPLTLAVDVLAPSHRPQLVSNVAVGADLVVDEVPGLPLALAMPATWCQATVQLTSGRLLDLHLPLADVVATLCLKAYAYRDRRLDRDALDIWRLLEAAHAAGVHAADWKLTGARLDAARILHDLYGRLGCAGPERATSSSGERQRIRALLTEVVARPDRAGRPS